MTCLDYEILFSAMFFLHRLMFMSLHARFFYVLLYVHLYHNLCRILIEQLFINNIQYSFVGS